MEQKYLFEDGSGDKEFFTIIPNYIANHSTSHDQSLYFQLKRLAGDTGKMCYPSNGYLMRKMGIGIKTLRKSFNYLIENKWIENLGKRKIMTAGGHQWVSAYKINNIWKLNMDYYRGGAERTPLEEIAKGVSKDTKEVLKESKGVLKDTKGVLVVACKEERKKELNKELNNNEQNEVLRITFKKEIDFLIEKFKSVNPTYERLFGNKTQRSALERLVKKFGKEKVENMIAYLPKIFGKKYAPRITSPYQLEMKMADLISYLQAEKSKVDDRKIVKI